MSLLRYLILPVVCGLALGACNPDPQEQWARAKQAYSVHDYQAARVDLMAALKTRPDDPVFLELLARTQIALDDGDGAETTLQHLQAIGKAPADHVILAADAALLKGQFAHALSLVNTHDSAEAARIRGLALLGQGKVAEAGKILGSGLESSGPRSALMAAYARYLLDEGELAEADRLARQALTDNGEERVALQVLAGVAAAQGRHAAALLANERLLKIYPHDLTGLFGTVSALGELGRIDEIEPVLGKIERLAPQHPSVVFVKARLAAERKDWAKVRAILQPLERDIDTRPELQWLYAQAFLNLGQVEQARAYLSPLLLHEPHNGDVRLALAQVQIAGRDGGAALATLRPFADDHQASVQALDLLARVAGEEGDPQAGIYAARARAVRNGS
ncbi:MAG: tetratricopeptide repeat protein [Rhodocyclaceae bacterium]|nr:MAG: tetratricopeptide repeat protein [Rhodocyclaceae bacterium]